jgi:nitrate/TMAO reductase-like tetraheme cytochrome c subunit
MVQRRVRDSWSGSGTSFSNSGTCWFARDRNCHSTESMDITKQSPRASVAHPRFLFKGEKTCIDCHKGIAHQLPNMRGVPGWQ